MVEKFLTTLSAILKKEGMDCSIFEESDEYPKARLLVYLGTDHRQRERTLEITADEQILPANFKDFETMQVESGLYRIQIQTLIPIDFHPQQAANMASAINFINGLLELPGLISDEVTNNVYYRNVQITASHDFNKTILIGIIGMHRMVLDVFTDMLQKIGDGEMTFLELLDEVVKFTNAA